VRTRPFALTARNGRSPAGRLAGESRSQSSAPTPRVHRSFALFAFSARALADGRRSPIALFKAVRSAPSATRKRQKIKHGHPLRRARLAAVSASFQSFPIRRFVNCGARSETCGTGEKADCPAKQVPSFRCGYCLSTPIARFSHVLCASGVISPAIELAESIARLPDPITLILENSPEYCWVTMSSTSPERRQNVLPSQWISPSGHRATSVQAVSQKHGYPHSVSSPIGEQFCWSGPKWLRTNTRETI